MNSAWRVGYNNGLAVAREHARDDKPFLSPGGVRLAASDRYGTANKLKIQQLKAGFRAGYAVGVQEAETLI